MRARLTEPEDLRKWVAIQGMGNPVSLEQMERGGFRLLIENPGLPLVTVGNAISFCEFMTGMSCDADWSVEDDGDLLIDLRVRSGLTPRSPSFQGQARPEITRDTATAHRIIETLSHP
ncbi:MAG: hypothetical protein ABH877_00830 [bacterium]